MKKPDNAKKSRLAGMGRAVVVASLLLAGLTALTLKLDPNAVQDENTMVENDGWGSEALVQLHEGLTALSPIPLANACGLGASSCFKCHNGKRAEAPGSDPATSPWHTEHLKVNNSCVGCHQGNPRLMKEKMAHRGMLANPTSDTKEACSTCHSGDNLEELGNKYLSLQGAK